MKFLGQFRLPSGFFAHLFVDVNINTRLSVRWVRDAAETRSARSPTVVKSRENSNVNRNFGYVYGNEKMLL